MRPAAAAEDLLIATLAGYAGTTVMEPVPHKRYELEPGRPAPAKTPSAQDRRAGSPVTAPPRRRARPG